MTYSVGLQNVGSYQVSGRPWSKTLTVTDGSQEKIELPSVSKKIRIKKQSSGGILFFGFRDMFIQRSRAADINIDDYYNVDVGLIHDSFSVSFWMFTGNLVDGVLAPGTTVFQGGYANDNLFLRKDGTSLVITQRNTGDSDIEFSVGNFSFQQWHHFTYQYDSPSGIFKLFIDGQEVINQARTRNSGLRVLRFSSVTAGTFDGPYDEISFWNKSLGQQEVSELYNQGNYYDPRTHSSSGNLLHWWAFEDGVGVGDFIDSGGQDTISLIIDRVGVRNLSLVNPTGPIEAVFVNSKEGWFVQSTTPSFNNTISIINEDEFEISCKCKEFYIVADGAPVNVDIFASLTNIPSSRMYDLTGPGINE